MAQEVEVKVKVETGQAVEGVNSLEKSFTKLDRSVSASKEKSVDYGKQILQSGQLTQKLSQATGGLSDAFINGAKGIDLTNLSLKGLKGAIASTGVGLLVIALGELITVLSDFFSAEKKSEKAVGELNKVLDAQSDSFDKVGESAKFVTDISLKYAKANGASKEELKKINDSYLASEKNRIDEELKLLEAENLAVAKNSDLTEEDRQKSLEKVKTNMQKLMDLRQKNSRDKQNADADFYVAEKEAEKQATDKATQKKEADNEKAKQFIIQQKQSLSNLEKKYRDDIANMEAKTEEEKLALQKSRALAELDLIKLSTKEKAEAKALIIKDFQDKEEALEKSHADKLLALNNKLEEDRKTLLAKTDEEKLALTQERARKQLELELTNDNASENEKRVARQNLQANFDIQDAELQTTKDEKAKEEKLAMLELELADDTTSFEQKKQLILDREALLLSDKTLSESKRVKIRKDSVEAEKKLDQLQLQAKQQQLAGIGNALQQASQMAGESTAVGKTLAVASATISTYTSAQKAYESAFLPVPTTASPILGNVFRGVAIASGLLNIKKILEVKTPNGGGGGGVSLPSAQSITPPSSTIAIPTPTNASPNVIGASGINQLATTLGGQAPIKAYVVGKDVSTQQALDRNIVNTATLG